MKNKLQFIVLLLLTNFLFSQNQDNNCYFGGQFSAPTNPGAGLDFNNSLAGIPSPLVNSLMGYTEGSACISDTNGKLLFYTDGIKVYNRCHQIMPNGLGLGGHSSSQFGALIVPNPANGNQYYIFGNDGHPTGTGAGLFHSIVDMTLDNNRGDVLAAGKKTLLLTNTSEFMQGANHANNQDYWVITIDQINFQGIIL